MRIERIETLSMAVREAITRPLAESATRQDFAFTSKYVTLAIMDGTAIDGGLVAQVYWDWMHIEILSVPEAQRGKGLGRALMERAEAEARAEGCSGIWVDTYSFQAPGFYERMGYRAFGTLPDYPRGEARLFFAKQFETLAEPDMPEAA